VDSGRSSQAKSQIVRSGTGAFTRPVPTPEARAALGGRMLAACCHGPAVGQAWTRNGPCLP